MSNKDFLLPKIINQATNRRARFSELDCEQKYRVLKYIDEQNIDVKITDPKWYDVLDGKFHCTEFAISDGGLFGYSKKEIVFESFDEYFAYVRGDIYENACYYGYRFSEETIDKYHIDVNALNMDALINETIDAYTFKRIKGQRLQDTEDSATKASAMMIWIENYPTISNYNDLNKAFKAFTETFGKYSSRQYFFSLVLNKGGAPIKNAAIKFACSHDYCDCFSFDDILLTYGREAALRVIDRFDGGCSYPTKRKRIKSFECKLAIYDSENHVFIRRINYDRRSGFYRVIDAYASLEYDDDLKSARYFGTLDDLAKYCNGDLSGGDFSEAPITKDEVVRYKIDRNTKFPYPSSYCKYAVSKECGKHGFLVRQSWLDENDAIIIAKEHLFDKFFDFAHFLKDDLSNADLLYCEGLENIKHISGLNLANIKVRSVVSEKLGLPIKQEICGTIAPPITFETTLKGEEETISSFLAARPEDGDYDDEIGYVSDIHLPHKLAAYSCKTAEDMEYVLHRIAERIASQASHVNLIAGDVSNDFIVFKEFIKALGDNSPHSDYFFVLGNHELMAMDSIKVDEAVKRYRDVLTENGNGSMYLIQNNLFYFDHAWTEIDEEELFRMDSKILREKTRGASMIILGGIGFAGMNDVFNATSGMYGNIVDRAMEISESARFAKLYEKVTDALKDRNLIVMTHMPMVDWYGKNEHTKEGVIYVSGHTHQNHCHDDGRIRVFADNQIGYRTKTVGLKKIPVNLDFDWFCDFEDGIHEITREDYISFYRGISESVTFNREYKNIYMLKNDGCYMFLVNNRAGDLLILNGGLSKKVANHPLSYFYDNMAIYARSVKMFLRDYGDLQKRVASDIRNIGGDGTIHGSIVDIDYFNHLYVNPFDGSITPYYAMSMSNKYVYSNIASLLKYRCPKLLRNYENNANNTDKLSVIAPSSNKLTISDKTTFVADTSIYKISRILKGLQFTTKYNVIRVWNDAIILDASNSNGRLIVSKLIESMPLPAIEKKPE